MFVTRLDVEKELERKSASIADSIARIRADLSLPTAPIKKAVKEHPMEVLLGAVVVGLACGWLVSGKKRSNVKSRPRPNRGGDLEPSVFLQHVSDGRAAGMSEEEVIERALALGSQRLEHLTSRPRPTLRDRLGDQAIGVAETVVRTALGILAREAADWIKAAVRRDKRPSSQ